MSKTSIATSPPREGESAGTKEEIPDHLSQQSKRRIRERRGKSDQHWNKGSTGRNNRETGWSAYGLFRPLWHLLEFNRFILVRLCIISGILLLIFFLNNCFDLPVGRTYLEKKVSLFFVVVVVVLKGYMFVTVRASLTCFSTCLRARSHKMFVEADMTKCTRQSETYEPPSVFCRFLASSDTPMLQKDVLMDEVSCVRSAAESVVMKRQRF